MPVVNQILVVLAHLGVRQPHRAPMARFEAMLAMHQLYMRPEDASQL